MSRAASETRRAQRLLLKALQARGVDAHAFDPAERELTELKRKGFKRCFIALHGRFGEFGANGHAIVVAVTCGGEVFGVGYYFHGGLRVKQINSSKRPQV